MIMFERCIQCGEDFQPRQAGQQTCSRRCYKIIYNRENAEKIARKGKRRYAAIRDKVLADFKARYKDDPKFREESNKSSRERLRARRAKFKAMGLNAHGKKLSKRGRKPLNQQKSAPER